MEGGVRMEIQSLDLARRVEHVDHVVFDVGNVLFRFDTEHIKRTFLTEQHREQLGNAMFVADHEWAWYQFDKGLWPAEEVAEKIACHAGLPGCGGEVLYAYEHYHEDRVPLPLTKDFAALKSMGKKIYALTNYGWDAFDRVYAKFDFFKELDGILVSGREKVWKPMPEIYQLMCSRFDLVPQRTLFIDDSPVNIQAAAALGWQTWLYETPDA